MSAAPITAVLLKFDVVASTQVAPEAMPQVRDAVECAATGYGVETGFPRWEGDGGSAYFLGEDAAQRAVQAAFDAVERVRLIAGYRVSLRTAVGIGDATEGADLTRYSPPDFDLAGHMVGGDVCPPSGVCVTEDVYFLVAGVAPDLARRFAYVGRTVRDGAAVFAWPQGQHPAKPGGLRPAAADGYSASLLLRKFYARPPFASLRFYALPQFNFVGALDLLSVFTPLSVRAHRGGLTLDEDFPPEEIPAEARSASTEEIPRERKFPRLRSAAPSQPFAAAFARARTLVVLGDPGSGKTTLLRYLAIAAAAGRHATRTRLGVAERLLPVHVTAAAALKARREHPEDTPACTCARVLVAQIDKTTVDHLAAAIAEAASAGEALFLVDGLDEIPEAADRLAVARWIEQLGGAHKACRIVVASRRVGYPGVALSGAEEVVLEPLTPEQTRTLARAFFTEFYRAQKYADAAAHSKGSAEGDRLAKVLEDRPTLAPFAGNPLLLSLAALVHVQLGELPRYRVKLYDVATETLVSAWAKARQAVGDPQPVRAVDYESEGRRVLPALALHLHEHCPGGVISQADLLMQVASRLPGAGSAAGLEDAVRARDFLARLQHAGSLLVERGAGRWGFLHETFQEYLAAKCLATEDRQDELLGERVYRPRWKEVIQFVAGEMGVVQGRGPATARFIRAILDDRTDWRATELRWNVLLAAECLADTLCTDAKLEDDLLLQLLVLIEDPRRARWRVENSLRQLRRTPLGDSLAARLATAVGKLPRTDELAALGRGDLAVPALLAALGRSDYSNLRREALSALGRLGDRKAIPDLLGALREDKLAKMRREAASALGALGSSEVIPDLLRAFREDKDGWVRSGAAEALGALGAREAIPDLLEALREDRTAWVRTGAAEALGALGVREVIPDLLNALRGDKDEWVRAGAAKALGALGVHEAIPDLLKALRGDKDEWVRGQAAEVLGDLGATQAIPELLQALRTDEDEFVHGGAAVALGALGAREAIPDLLKTLRDDQDRWARAGAASALGDLGARKAIEPLRQTVAKDPDATVAAASAAALWRIVEMEADAVPAPTP